MLLVIGIALLSLWGFFFSFSLFSNFLNSVFIMFYLSRRDLASLFVPALTVWFVPTSCPRRHISLQDLAFLCTKTQHMIVMLGSQQSFALFPVCPSRGAVSASLFPLSVAGLSAANSLTPVSPKSNKRELKHARRQRLQFG